MDINDMNLDQVVKRLAELDTEVRSANEVKVIENLTEEKKTLLTRKAELEDLEQRKTIALQINTGEVAGKIIEERKEGNKMDINYNVSSPEYRSAFLKELQGKKLTEVEERALTTVAASTAAAIPTTLNKQIVDKLVQVSALYNRVSVTNIPGNVTFAVASAKNDASFKTEGSEGTPADDTVVPVSLSGYELIKLIEISAAAYAMTMDAFEMYISDEIARKMAIAIENFILNGTGSAQPTGLLASSQITNVGTFTKAGMTYKDLLKILAALPTMYHSNACMVMPRKLFFEEIIGMTTTAGDPVVVQNPQSPLMFNVLGYPVIIDDYMPTDTIVFGDCYYYKINFSQGITIDSDRSVGFKSGKVTYRGLAIVDGKPALPEAFVKYTRTTA